MTNATKGQSSSPEYGPFAASPSWPELRNSGFWDSLGGATLKLGALFWISVLFVDSVMWGVAGVDPIDSFVPKLITNSFGVGFTVLITAALYRFRSSSLLSKVGLAFGLSAVGAPLYGMIDFEIYKWAVWPQQPQFDLGNFGYTLVSCTATLFGWSCLYVSLVYSFEVRDQERKLAAAREEAIGAQMRALRYQINPHFLFNTLNSIAGLIEEGAATRAERMVLSLSTFLRTTLELDPLHDVTLAEELALQQDYLEIERERFSDRMDFAIRTEDGVRAALVPSLILQPLIENAIKHGVGRSARPVDIRIIATKRDNRLCITVENGIGLGGVAAQGFGIGLRNVSDRLGARFGQEARFSAGIVDSRTYRAEIEMPWRTA